MKITASELYEVVRTVSNDPIVMENFKYYKESKAYHKFMVTLVMGCGELNGEISLFNSDESGRYLELFGGEINDICFYTYNAINKEKTISRISDNVLSQFNLSPDGEEYVTKILSKINKPKELNVDMVYTIANNLFNSDEVRSLFKKIYPQDDVNQLHDFIMTYISCLGDFSEARHLFKSHKDGSELLMTQKDGRILYFISGQPDDEPVRFISSYILNKYQLTEDGKAFVKKWLY